MPLQLSDIVQTLMNPKIETRKSTEVNGILELSSRMLADHMYYSHISEEQNAIGCGTVSVYDQPTTALPTRHRLTAIIGFNRSFQSLH